MEYEVGKPLKPLLKLSPEGEGQPLEVCQAIHIGAIKQLKNLSPGNLFTGEDSSSTCGTPGQPTGKDIELNALCDALALTNQAVPVRKASLSSIPNVLTSR